MSKKATKNRAKKYEEKIKVDASFNELMGALFPKEPAKKDKEPLPKSKKKKSKK